MNDLNGKIAVVTGGGSGIGRALVQQLSAAGCHVACCDLDSEGLEQTRSISLQEAPEGTHISLHICDVADEQAMQSFATQALTEHSTDHFNLLINNAGIAGGGSFISDPRDQWEKTFGVCWGGVYIGCRVFLPLLIKSTEGHVINISSVNGFWACMSPNFPHTAYSAAKFAVKGFSEALMIDLQINAPHVGLSVVMPGHIGTSIAINARKVHDLVLPANMSAEEIAEVRKLWARLDEKAGQLDDATVVQMLELQGQHFRDNAPTTAAEAATIILDGMRSKQWRILVGDDAVGMDAMVREEPQKAYTLDFFQRLQAKGIFDQTAV